MRRKYASCAKLQVSGYSKQNVLCLFFMAYGNPVPCGSKPPISNRVFALNSFVLPIRILGVSFARILSHCSNGVIRD